jgi:glycosyltransferase involved in cell wall biosynthesis
MSPPGRPKGESLSAKRDGGPFIPPGRPKGESQSAKREGGPFIPPGRPVSGEVRLLTLTSLYPSAARPRHGIFVESRLRRLVARGGVTAHVVAPVPWFPSQHPAWGEYARLAATPAREVRYGIAVLHPRYVTVPRVGMRLQPVAYAQAARRAARQLLADGAQFDLIDAHYLYPDGVAAARLAQTLGLPYVLSARGSDVNVIAHMPGPQREILKSIEGAAAVIAVSAALKAALMGLGVPSERITVLRNGVDAELFSPQDRPAARRALGLPDDSAPVVCSVGNLVAGKRHDLAIRAALAAGARIVVVGRGPERSALDRLARTLGAADRVHFVEEMPQDRLRTVYSAADALVLASISEGWPNVLLESAACGTPVVAFSVGGIPEILGDPAVGTLVREAPAAEPLANALRRLLSAPPARDTVRAAALKFSWDPVLDAQAALYRRVARRAADAPLERDSATVSA